MKRALFLLALAACGPTDNFYVPVGFVGSIGTCHATAASGALSLDSGGWVHGERVGHGDVRCVDGSGEGVGVRTLARLTLEGPDAIHAGDSVYYDLHAFDAHGTELSLIDEARIAWRSSAGSIDPAYCSDMPLFGCPGMDHARVIAPAGPLTITVEYLGLSVVKQVAVQ